MLSPVDPASTLLVVAGGWLVGLDVAIGPELVDGTGEFWPAVLDVPTVGLLDGTCMLEEGTGTIVLDAPPTGGTLDEETRVVELDDPPTGGTLEDGTGTVELDDPPTVGTIEEGTGFAVVVVVLENPPTGLLEDGAEIAEDSVLDSTVEDVTGRLTVELDGVTTGVRN